MYEENIRSLVEEGSLGVSMDSSMVSEEMSSSGGSPSSLAVSGRRMSQDDEERLVMNVPILQLPDYPDIPSHLIDEFEKLCDKKEDSEEGFEPSIVQPKTEIGPCKMLKTGKDLVRSFSMKSLKGVLGSNEEEKSNKSKTFECPHCEKTFHLLFLLKKHVASNHRENNGKNLHPCPFCKKSFRFSILLRRHVQYKHKENKPTVGRDFSDEKEEFPCEVCGKSFTQSGNMKRHMKTVHADVETFNCEDCGKSFKNSSNLKRHMSSHVKPEEEDDNKMSGSDLKVRTESLV